MDIESAGQKCRNAGIAACVQGVLALAVISFSIYSGAETDDPTIQYFNDPFLFIDIAIIFALAGGLFLRSRTAAVLLLVYYVLSQIMFIAETGRVGGIVVSLVFVYFYYQGIIGAFAYTRLRRKEEPKYRKKPTWLLAIVSVAVLILLGVIGLGLVMTFMDSPSTAVEKGEDLPESFAPWLRENGVIEADETIDMFYSEGVFSIEEGGNLLTNRRVISYFRSEEGELEIHSAAYDEITNIILKQKGDVLSDSLVQVVYGPEEDQGWFYLLLSAEKGGDEKFIELLERRSTVKMTIDIGESAE